MLSRRSRMACMASRWSGRKSENPHTLWRASRSRRSTSGVGVLDVLIDETLKLRGELVVGAAQSGDVLPVDVHGAVRRFTGAGQADPDVRRLRFAGAVDDAPHDGQRH